MHELISGRLKNRFKTRLIATCDSWMPVQPEPDSRRHPTITVRTEMPESFAALSALSGSSTFGSLWG